MTKHNVKELLEKSFEEMSQSELINLHSELESYICNNGMDSWDYLRKRKES